MRLTESTPHSVGGVDLAVYMARVLSETKILVFPKGLTLIGFMVQPMNSRVSA